MADWSDDFLDNMAIVNAGLSASSSNVIPIHRTQPDAHHPFVATALRNRLTELAAMPADSGRNHALNVAAAYLGRFPLDRQSLRQALIDACRANGLLTEDGLRQCDATISSGFRKADADGARSIDRNNFAKQAIQRSTATPAAKHDEDEQRDLYRIAVERHAYELKVREAGRRLFASDQASVLGQQMPVPESLTELLAVPDADVQYRIDQLAPFGARVLLVAQYKTGKTTMMANLLRSLADGDKFLGRYHTDIVERVTIIDTELDKRMLRRWLRTQRIRNPDRVNIISLRAKLSTFDIIDPAIRSQWAHAIAGSKVIILDCLRPCIDALGLSEDKDAGKFLIAFDALLAEAQVEEAVVVHHMGHNQERSRGDSRLLDWPDVIWKIVRDHDENGDAGDATGRYFSATGRDVSVTESLLSYASKSGSLMIRGGSRADKEARSIFTELIEILSDPANSDGLSQRQLVAKLIALGNGRNNARKAIRMAIEESIVVTSQGDHRADVHTLNSARKG